MHAEKYSLWGWMGFRLPGTECREVITEKILIHCWSRDLFLKRGKKSINVCLFLPFPPSYELRPGHYLSSSLHLWLSCYLEQATSESFERWRETSSPEYKLCANKMSPGDTIYRTIWLLTDQLWCLPTCSENKWMFNLCGHILTQSIDKLLRVRWTHVLLKIQSISMMPPKVYIHLYFIKWLTGAVILHTTVPHTLVLISEPLSLSTPSTL